MALTKRQVDAASYAGDGSSWDVRYDGQLPGFGLRVYPSGTKSFILRYRTPRGRVRTVTIGRYGPLTVDQARQRARRMLAEVYDGRDPAEERKRKRAEGITVKEFAKRWLEEYAKSHRSSWREDQRRIHSRILPALGRQPLADVTPGDVAKLHGAIGQLAPVEANRVLQLVRGIFNAAIAWQVLPEGHQNPARVSRSPYGGSNGVRTFGEESRKRYVRPDEMPSLLEAITEDPDEQARAILQLLLYTGCRKTEILRARWKDVNLERGELALPHAKTGARTVQLSSAATEVLEGISRSESPYVFPSPQDPWKPRSDIRRAWRRIRDRASLQDVRMHDLRRTVGSWLADSGISDLIIGDVLGHRDPAATRIYAKLTDKSARDALEAFAAAVRGRPLTET